MIDVIYVVGTFTDVNGTTHKRVSQIKVDLDSEKHLKVMTAIDLQNQKFRWQDYDIKKCDAVGFRYTKGLQFFCNTLNTRIDDTSPLKFGAQFPPIIGVFSTEEEALKCFNSDNLQPWDKRFRAQSLRILRVSKMFPHNILSVDRTLEEAMKTW